MKVLVVAASPEGEPDLVRLLARGVDLVIAVDGGGALCLRAGVTPHVVVGDLDSLETPDREALERAGVGFQAHPADKDVSDLRLALETARDQGARRVVATGVLGGRHDHSLGGIGELARFADLRPIVEEADTTVHFASGPHRPVIRVRGDGTTFSAIAVLDTAEVSIVGARWPLSHRLMEPLGTLGLSNRVVGEAATVTVHRGTLAVIAPTVEGTRAALQDEDDVGEVGYTASVL